ncbi:MAG: hypothetical protein GMKNLPBB_00120 [Myxococcota bacterium]|nr:hypothetical protein [Myxococcota bacterium]
MMKKPKRVLLAGLAALALAAGCAARGGGELRAQADVVREKTAMARSNGAEKCAPRELAHAEAYLKAAEEDLFEGQFVRADGNLLTAATNVDLALDITKRHPDRCKDVEIIIAKRAPKIDPCSLDDDKDGVNNCEDTCLSEKGPRENKGCPWGDKDGDGILDNEDECKELKGVREFKGCPPPDQDKDGILDADDRCPQQPGPAEYKGCPDTDGDTVPDPDDKCPSVAGAVSNHGCPVEVKKAQMNLAENRIEIKEQVQFDTGKATIRKASNALLSDVATLIKTYKITRIRVEGHTDDRGNDDMNMKLSQARAESVVKFLVINHKIDPSIFDAQGFGESSPIASNRTDSGRQQNRRVEFHVLEIDGKPVKKKAPAEQAE